MPTTVHEIERRYLSDPGVAPRVLAELSGVSATAGPHPPQVLDATYFDTEDLRLAAHGITLCHSSGDHEAGWRLTLPSGRDERDQVRAPAEHPGAGAPAELAERVRAHTRRHELGPVAHIRVIRTRHVLRDTAGAPLAEIAEDEVAAQTLGRSTTLSAWHEVEVDLTGGDRALLRRLDRRLRAEGARTAPDTLPRLLAERLSEQPAERARHLGKKPSAGDVALAYLVRQVDAMLAADREVRAGTPGAVRELRAAASRLRRTLCAFRPLLREQATRPVEAELRWLADLLGVVRAAEAMRERYGRRLALTPADPSAAVTVATARAHLERAFAATENAGHAVLRVELDGDRYFRLLDRLEGLLADPPLRGKASRRAKKTLPKRVRRGASEAGERTPRWDSG